VFEPIFIKVPRKHMKKKKIKQKKIERGSTWPQPIKPAQLASPTGAQATYRIGIDQQVGPTKGESHLQPLDRGELLGVMPPALLAPRSAPLPSNVYTKVPAAARKP
jgi:hypothetical protein